MAPVYQDRELNRPWSSEVHQPVESGADGTPGEQHIIYKDNALAGKRKRNLRAFDLWMIDAMPQIIAVQRDIHHPQRHDLSLDVAELRGHPSGQMNPPRPDAD